MAVLLRGCAAGVVRLGEVCSGAAYDLANATDIALDMVTRLGMSGELGQVAYERQRTPFLAQLPQFGSERNYSEDTARHIDEAVRQLIDGAFARATEGLQARRSLLEQGARLLLERETLTEAELAPLVASARALPA